MGVGVKGPWEAEERYGALREAGEPHCTGQSQGSRGSSVDEMARWQV
jgi:hypothetical protein